MRHPCQLALLWLLVARAAPAQTTQAVVVGQVVDGGTAQPLSAVVSYINLDTAASGEAPTNKAGYYALPPLSPGVYLVRAVATGYQPQEVQNLVVVVAARVDVSFRLRPQSDVLDSGRGNIVVLPETETVLPIIGPDLDRGRVVAIRPAPVHAGVLFATISHVIDRTLLEELPLAGRDVYAMLAMLPGVTAENATGRGLGFSVNGQRPSASNYLLDGVENNDYLVTGPLTVAPPEAIQEYRVSTANFSAEYGRTSGFLTNAITRPGAEDWHGVGYFYWSNDALDANSSARNAGFRENTGTFGPSLPRTPRKVANGGAQVGGAIATEMLFSSTSVDFLRSRSFGSPVRVMLPTASFLSGVLRTLPEDSSARKLFSLYAPPPVISSAASATLEMNPPVSIDRTLASERIDYIPGSDNRWMLRAALSRRSEPEFIWSPYRDFISGLRVNSSSVALGWIGKAGKLSSELRASWGRQHLEWNRAHPEIPTLLAGNADLPGSRASYSYRNGGTTWEILENVSVPLGAHFVKAGGGILLRRLSGRLTFGSGGLYLFNSLNSVIQDQPSSFTAGIDRQFRNRLPQYGREYRYNQFFFYAEDSHKAAERLTLNYGVRYENFGAPVNVGSVKDYRIRLASGDPAGIRAAVVDFPGEGDQQLYPSDGNNWSARLGFAYGLDRRSRTVLRGGYGIFYDRPFDNLWQNLRNNNTILASVTNIGVRTNFLAPVAEQITRFRFDELKDFLIAYQPGIRDGYVQSYFLGGQRQFGNLLVEVIGAGSAGRKLLTTDVINREYSDSGRRHNPLLGDINYRSSQGSSNYLSLIAVASYRARRAQFQASYTWGHSIDTQSDPLAGEFFNLNFTQSGRAATNNATAAFGRQFDSRGDRGNSDFDQRHNAVFFSVWSLPDAPRHFKGASIFRGWKLAELAAARTGFPFSVFANVGEAPRNGGQLLPNPRADLIGPEQAVQHVPVQGGIRLLNAAAFAPPDRGVQGNTGRNAFRGPGLFSVDLSLSRSVRPRWFGESAKLTFRADFYNVLNHANLNNPDATVIGSPDFGVARFGRTGRASGFPAIAPLNETARQIQLMVRFHF